jgi:hypothetical protein
MTLLFNHNIKTNVYYLEQRTVVILLSLFRSYKKEKKKKR